jgi:hypothetical protein
MAWGRWEHQENPFSIHYQPSGHRFFSFWIIFGSHPVPQKQAPRAPLTYFIGTWV